MNLRPLRTICKRRFWPSEIVGVATQTVQRCVERINRLYEQGAGAVGISTKSFVRHGQETIAPQSVAKRDAQSGVLTGQFGRYRIIRALGKRAMGTVYLAEDTQLERSVAIKTPHFTKSPTEESLERFRKSSCFSTKRG